MDLHHLIREVRADRYQHEDLSKDAITVRFIDDPPEADGDRRNLRFVPGSNNPQRID